MTKATSFYLLAALSLLPTLAIPAFAEDGRDAPGGDTSIMATVHTVSPTTPVLTPYPPQWWKDN